MRHTAEIRTEKSEMARELWSIKAATILEEFRSGMNNFG